MKAPVSREKKVAAIRIHQVVRGLEEEEEQLEGMEGEETEEAQITKMMHEIGAENELTEMLGAQVLKRQLNQA
ncbi:unnamed protein product [Strongylus vulgaris]|uniref:Uncharacterized protein n=1 Tax=Strongylus vulgaris TaxID=40348 RepID=A0A3P7J6J5_STRVU|nr:unnamed protein product [Strongylus vulgaris]